MFKLRYAKHMSRANMLSVAKLRICSIIHSFYGLYYKFFASWNTMPLGMGPKDRHGRTAWAAPSPPRARISSTPIRSVQSRKNVKTCTLTRGDFTASQNIGLQITDCFALSKQVECSCQNKADIDTGGGGTEIRLKRQKRAKFRLA